MIAITQYTFTITSIAFLTTSLRDVCSKASYGSDVVIESKSAYEVGDLRYIWTYGVVLVCLLSMLAWVRNIAVFSFTFLIANILLLSTVVIVCAYSTSKLITDGINESVEAINLKGVWTMLGFAVYVFEGIGILMPVMQACDCPEKFSDILNAALMTLCSAFAIFGTLSYLAFGNMKAQMATQMLPQGDLIVKMMIVGYVVLLVFSYPLTINPTNTIIDFYTSEKCMKKSSTCRTYVKNISRVITCLTAAYLGIEFADKLDKVIGLLGALFCAPVAMILPAFCHLVLVAKTQREKFMDIITVVFSTVLMIFCIGTTLFGTE